MVGRGDCCWVYRSLIMGNDERRLRHLCLWPALVWLPRALFVWCVVEGSGDFPRRNCLTCSTRKSPQWAVRSLHTSCEQERQWGPLVDVRSSNLSKVMWPWLAFVILPWCLVAVIGRSFQVPLDCFERCSQGIVSYKPPYGFLPPITGRTRKLESSAFDLFCAFTGLCCHAHS